MKTYQHKQRATLILVVFAVIALVDLILGLRLSRLSWIVFPVVAICAWLFHSLTIEITDGELRWRFGPGLIRKRVALDMIVSVERVRTNVLEGWGIHLSRFGWLYNVSGFDAVAIKMKNGQHFALGTDDAARLMEHLPARRMQNVG